MAFYLGLHSTGATSNGSESSRRPLRWQGWSTHCVRRGYRASTGSAWNRQLSVTQQLPPYLQRQDQVDIARLFTVLQYNRMYGKRIFPLCRQKLNSIPKQPVPFPLLEIFKTQVGKALITLVLPNSLEQKVGSETSTDPFQPDLSYD